MLECEDMEEKASENDQEILELKKITEELRMVNENTGSTWVAFLRGILQGGGAVVGSLVAIILIGLALSVLGVIPGFKSISEYVGSVVNQIRH